MMKIFSNFFPFYRKKEKKIKNPFFEMLDLCDKKAFLFTQEGKILYFNKQGEKLFSFENSSLLSSTFFEYRSETHPLLLAECHNLLQRAFEKQSVLSTSFSLLGEAFEIKVYPLQKGKYFVLTISDSSSHERVEQMGRDFIANASHELRTPITIIKGFAETMRDLPEISEAMLEDFTEKIVRNCERMDNLVKNLLTLADLDRHPLSNLQECDLVSLLENTIQTILFLHPEVRIEMLRNKDQIPILANPDFLELALLNLLENGIKYSSSLAKILLTIEETKEKVSLKIADQGIGIPEKDLDFIFDRFYTVNKAHSRRLGGAGLGLSIVKLIVQKHRGEISVRSELGKGTEFTLLFDSCLKN
ncbi:MAG: GHKL domain-containing protein [Simkania negevensis]|nr:GHKL domain-containing protein [Simkania negevensis]